MTNLEIIGIIIIIILCLIMIIFGYFGYTIYKQIENLTKPEFIRKLSKDVSMGIIDGIKSETSIAGIFGNIMNTL